MEKDAREQLESHGCPPCYPPNLALPLDDVPTKYRSIIEYWKAQPGVRYEVLCAQLHDWQRFRKFQARARRSCGKESFRQYNLRIRGHSQPKAKGLADPVPLHFDISMQDRMQNWIDFAHYHRTNHETLTEQRNAAETMFRQDLRVSDDDMIAAENRRDYYGRLVRQHASLMDWIEEVQHSQPSMLGFWNSSQNGTGRTNRPPHLPTAYKKSLRVSSKGAKTKKPGLRADSAKNTTGRRHRKHRRVDPMNDVISELVRTRSGRISRRPARWTPG